MVTFFQYLYESVCRFDAFNRCFLFSKTFSNVSSFSLLLFMRKISARIFYKLYFSNLYKKFSQSLVLTAKCMLHYRCIVSYCIKK